MRVWLRFLRLFLPYRGRLLLTLLATLVRPLLNAAKIYLLKLIVDDLAHNPTSHIVYVIAGGYLAIALVKGIASFGDDYLGAYVGGRIIVDLRQLVFDRFLRLSLRYHGEHRVGESLSRLIGDVGAIETMLVSGLTDGTTQVLTVLVFAGMLFYLDPRLALISLAVLPCLFTSLVIYARRSRFAFREVRQRIAELTSVAEETLSNVALVKSLMRHAHEGDRFRARGLDHWHARMSATRQRAIFIPISDVVATSGAVLVVYFGAQALVSGTLTIGGLVIFLAYLGQLYNPLLGLSRLGNSLQGGVSAAERVAAVLDLPIDEDEPFAATQPMRQLAPRQCGAAPAIEFEHVTFAYSSGAPALSDFSLTVPRGSLVALVGASGAGKSTAIALLQRFYDPEIGAIRLFGHDLREGDTETLRRQLAVVPQEPTLLVGNIHDNIAYGDLGATERAILGAAHQADLPRMRLPAGLDTPVGPRGSKLSGGQRQRVAIARALVRAAPVLVLDEATAALDALSEERLRALLETLRGRHTMLVIAHRLSTIRNADLIAVMDRGRVVDLGRHEDLLARGGAYAALVRAQQPPPARCQQDHDSDLPSASASHAAG